MNWEQIGYAAACVILPLGWGLVVVWVSNLIDRRVVGRRRGQRRHRPRPIEYHI